MAGCRWQVAGCRLQVAGRSKAASKLATCRLQPATCYLSTTSVHASTQRSRLASISVGFISTGSLGCSANCLNRSGSSARLLAG